MLCLGHEAMIVCQEGSEYQVSFPVISIPSYEFENVEFWKTQELDFAIVFTSLHNSATFRSLKKANVFTFSRADIDGIISVRVFPKEFFQCMVLPKSNGNFLKRAKIAKHWLMRYLYFHHREDEEVLECLHQADWTILQTQTALDRLKRILQYRRRSELSAKVIVMPHVVSTDILEAAIPTEKKRKVVAVGRWDDWYKGTPLLVRSLETFLSDSPETQVVLIGRGGERPFAPLVARFPNVQYLGAVPHEDIKNHLADARIMLVTSTRETFHIAAHEALCLGCSLVGPKIVPLIDVCRTGIFGTVAERRTPRSVAQALSKEMLSWDKGERSVAEIAHFWRPCLSIITLVEQLVQLYSESKQAKPLAGQASTLHLVSPLSD